jgi:hypothetical protein
MKKLKRGHYYLNNVIKYNNFKFKAYKRDYHMEEIRKLVEYREVLKKNGVKNL